MAPRDSIYHLLMKVVVTSEVEHGSSVVLELGIKTFRDRFSVQIYGWKIMAKHTNRTGRVLGESIWAKWQPSRRLFVMLKTACQKHRSSWVHLLAHSTSCIFFALIQGSTFHLRSPQSDTLTLSLETLDHTACHKRRIGPGVSILRRCLCQFIIGIKPTGRPGGVAQENIGVVREEAQFLAQIGRAIVVVQPARFGEQGKAAFGSEIIRKSRQATSPVGRANVVRHTVTITSRVVGVQVLVNLEDQLRSPTCRIGDTQQSRAGAIAVRREICGRMSPALAWENDHL